MTCRLHADISVKKGVPGAGGCAFEGSRYQGLRPFDKTCQSGDTKLISTERKRSVLDKRARVLPPKGKCTRA